MVYTKNEKERMERLLDAFADFLADSTEIDIAYSDKSGYVRLIIDECADSVFFRIPSFDDLLRMFTMDVVYNEVNKAWDLDHNLTNQTMNYELPRKRMQDYVSALDEDREYALSEIDKYIECWKNNDLLP